LPLVEVYGMTEDSGPATANPPDRMRLGTVGVAIPGVEVKLAEDGEVLVRGGNVSPGYYKDPEKTAETFGRDGWLHTGDIGVMDGGQRAVDDANQHVSQVEGIKRFAILPTEWTVDSEELTPTLKLKRRVIMEKYAEEIDGLYA